MKKIIGILLMAMLAVVTLGTRSAMAEAHNNGSEQPAPGQTVTLKGKVVMYLIDAEEPTRQIDRYIETDWNRQVVAFVLRLPHPIRLADYVGAEELDFFPEESVSEVQIVAPQGTDLKSFASKACTVKGKIEIRAAGWRHYNGVVIVATDIRSGM